MRVELWPLLLLAILVPALLLLYAHGFRRRRQALALLIDEPLAPRLLPPLRDRWVRAICLVVAAACLVIVLMQPRWSEREGTGQFRGRDIVVLLDLSLSMLAEDRTPSRLAQAKAAARSLVEAIQGEGGHRIALVTFAGRADVSCPLTRDYALFLDRLEVVTTDSVAQRGSSIGAALLQSVRMFGDLDPNYADLILLSDGEDHDGDPVEAARLLGKQGITVHTVGIGSFSDATPIPVGGPKTSPSQLVYQGKVVLTRMRQGNLAAMAEAAGGRYLPLAGESSSLEELYHSQIAPKPRREAEAGTHRGILPEPFQLLMLLAIVLLAGEMLTRSGSREKA